MYEMITVWWKYTPHLGTPQMNLAQMHPGTAGQFGVTIGFRVPWQATWQSEALLQKNSLYGTMGQHWTHHHVQVLCDNAAMVYILDKLITL